MTKEIPLEVLKAVKAMNEEKFINAIATGNAEVAGESLKRMAYALSQIDQYKVKEQGK
jgi:phosphotransacetylase